MPRIRKGKNRTWSKEEKIRLVNRHLIDGVSTNIIAKEEDISGGMLRQWVKKYLEYGEESLINKRKPGNALAKYSSKAIKDLQGRIVKLKPIEYDSFTNLFGLPNTHIVCEIWYQGQFYHKYTVMRKNTLEEKIFCDDNGRIIVFDSLTDILCHVNSYWYSKGFVRIK